jgi:hypothetical protein
MILSLPHRGHLIFLGLSIDSPISFTFIAYGRELTARRLFLGFFGFKDFDFFRL